VKQEEGKGGRKGSSIWGLRWKMKKEMENKTDRSKR
jgi:hypothetical protein